MFVCVFQYPNVCLFESKQTKRDVLTHAEREQVAESYSAVFISRDGLSCIRVNAKYLILPSGGGQYVCPCGTNNTGLSPEKRALINGSEAILWGPLQWLIAQSFLCQKQSPHYKHNRVMGFFFFEQKQDHLFYSHLWLHCPSATNINSGMNQWCLPSEESKGLL